MIIIFHYTLANKENGTLNIINAGNKIYNILKHLYEYQYIIQK